MAEADPLIGMTIQFSPPPAGRDPGEAPRGGLGSQVLPVADYLEHDYEGEPEDGLEYLFMVRREARQHRKGTRAQFLFADDPHDELIVSAGAAAEPEPPSNRPSESWRRAFLAQVTALRKRMAAAPARREFPSSSHVALPAAKDDSAWKLFINGRSLPRAPLPTIKTKEQLLAEAKAAALATLDLDVDDGRGTEDLPPAEPDALPPAYDPEHPPRLPTPAIMAQMNQHNMISLLEHFTEWFLERQDAPAQPRQRPPLPSAHELNWVLSILSKLDSLQDGDDISILRTLAKVVAGMIETSEEWFREEGQGGGEVLLDEDDAEGRAKGWMVLATIAGVWNQNDLWNTNL